MLTHLSVIKQVRIKREKIMKEENNTECSLYDKHCSKHLV